VWPQEVSKWPQVLGGVAVDPCQDLATLQNSAESVINRWLCRGGEDGRRGGGRGSPVRAISRLLAGLIISPLFLCLFTFLPPSLSRGGAQAEFLKSIEGWNRPRGIGWIEDKHGIGFSSRRRRNQVQPSAKVFPQLE